MIHSPFPETLLDFQKAFPNEAACAAYLEQLRWPEGFVCHRCGTSGEPFRFAKRITVLRCRNCEGEIRLTAGTDPTVAFRCRGTEKSNEKNG